jgi:hypothetical protein
MPSGRNKQSVTTLLMLAGLLTLLVQPAAAFVINVPEPSSYLELGVAGIGLAGWAVWRFSSRKRNEQ